MDINLLLRTDSPDGGSGYGDTGKTCIGGGMQCSSASSSLYNGSTITTRMWANAQRDGRPAEHRWRPLFNAAKFG